MPIFENISEWINSGVASLFTAGLGVLGLYLFIKRKILMAIGSLILAGFAAMFIFNGSTVAQKIANWFVQLMN